MSLKIYAQNFLKSGANLAAILTVKSSLMDKQTKVIHNSWNKVFRRGSDGEKSGIAVLQGNMKYNPLTVNPVDAQFPETRKFNVTDIAYFFRIFSTKLFNFMHSSYSTVEATQPAFLTDMLSPILQKFELEFE
ncbi:MAG: phage portal protein, partial [Dysgonamonadaceae bacterium]|nr:phage portal protein [Dysgonamonadaceae bacterium]